MPTTEEKRPATGVRELLEALFTFPGGHLALVDVKECHYDVINDMAEAEAKSKRGDIIVAIGELETENGNVSRTLDIWPVI